MTLFQVTSAVRYSGKQVCLPDYSNVIKADTPLQAVRIGFDHAAELGRPQTTLHVAVMTEPEDDLPGIVYETNQETTYRRENGRVRQVRN